MNHIEKITINNFKSIKELDNLSLHNINIIVGANGAGKTNFINALEMILEAENDHDLQEYLKSKGDTNNLFFKNPEATNDENEISIKLKFKNDETIHNVVFALNEQNIVYIKNMDGNVNLQKNNDELPQKKEIIKQYTDDNPYLTNITKFISDLGKNLDGKIEDINMKETIEIAMDTLMKQVETIDTEKKSNHNLKMLNTCGLYHFHDTSPRSKIRGFSNVADNIELHKDASNIASILLHMKETAFSSYEYIEKSIQLIAPYFKEFVLEEEGKEQIRLRWKQKGLKNIFSPQQFSDGTIRFIAIITALLQKNRKSTLIIDEPELGLHPEALRVISGIIQSVSDTTQVILSTQSVIFLDTFKVEDIIVCDRIDDASVFKRLDETQYSQWLEDYTLGDIWNMGLIGGDIND